MPADPTDDEALWRAARSFEALCELGSRYVAGEIAHFPGWGSESLDDESDALVEALVAFNRSGFLTLASQPGQAPQVRHDAARPFAQRAFVNGFADARAHARIVSLAANPDFVVLACGAREVAGERLPVGLFGDEPYLFAGYGAGSEELEIFADGIHPDGLHALERTSYVSVVDRHWSQRDDLWRELRRVLV